METNTATSAVDFSGLDTTSIVPTINAAFQAVLPVALTVAIIRKGYSIFMSLVRGA